MKTTKALQLETLVQINKIYNLGLPDNLQTIHDELNSDLKKFLALTERTPLDTRRKSVPGSLLKHVVKEGHFALVYFTKQVPMQDSPMYNTLTWNVILTLEKNPSEEVLKRPIVEKYYAAYQTETACTEANRGTLYLPTNIAYFIENLGNLLTRTYNATPLGDPMKGLDGRAKLFYKDISTPQARDEVINCASTKELEAVFSETCKDWSLKTYLLSETDVNPPAYGLFTGKDYQSVEDVIRELLDLTFSNPSVSGSTTTTSLSRYSSPGGGSHNTINFEELKQPVLDQLIPYMIKLGAKVYQASPTCELKAELQLTKTATHYTGAGYIDQVIEYNNIRYVIFKMFKIRESKEYKDYINGSKPNSLNFLKSSNIVSAKLQKPTCSALTFSHQSIYYNHLDVENLILCPAGNARELPYNYYGGFTNNSTRESYFSSLTIVYGAITGLPTGLPVVEANIRVNLPYLRFQPTATNAELSAAYSKYLSECAGKFNYSMSSSNMSEKFKTKIRSLLADPSKTLKYNDVTFYGNGIEYEGQKVNLDFYSNHIDKNNGNVILKRVNTDWILDVTDNLVNSGLLLDLNFDIVMDRVFDAISRGFINKHHGEGSYMNINIGDTKTRLEVKFTKNQTAELYYLNNKKINKAEIISVLKQAMTYSSQDAWDEFLEEVSKCSLRFHEYTSKGFVCQFVDDILDTGAKKGLIKLKRVKNLNYLTIAGKDYKIRDTNRFLSSLGENSNFSTYISSLFETLSNPNIVESFNLEFVGQLLAESSNAYEVYDKTQKALLQTLTAVTNSVYAAYSVGSAGTVNGVKVKGSLADYVIAFDNENSSVEPKVYKYPTGEYICIIDKTPGLNGWEKTFNRALALVNDSYLAKAIHTLN